MKTQFVNIDQALLNIGKLMIDSVKSFKWNNPGGLAPRFSADKVGYYLLPLVKQLFRDNFMGSDMEMGMLLIFLKGYFTSVRDALRNNVLTDLLKKLSRKKAQMAVLSAEKNYRYQQAA